MKYLQIIALFSIPFLMIMSDPKSRKNRLFGGVGDDLDESDVDPKELVKGIKIEMEHTDDPEIAREIALDHLAEDKKYYTKLAKIHKD